MRTLSIDIGTNSTLYLVADIEDGNLEVVERGIAGNRLGIGKGADGWLPSELIEENRQILVGMLKRGEELRCHRIKAVGTQALRSARNSVDFVAITNSIGLDLEIIDGEREAKMAWQGVIGNHLPSEQVAILDIGGGSSELIVGRGSEIEFSSSISIGAVTATRQFNLDPPSESEIKMLRNQAKEMLRPWLEVAPLYCPLIGIAGTCTSLASLGLQTVNYKPGVFEGYWLTRQAVVDWKERLLRLSLEERKALPGMPPARAEILPAGTVILEIAMEMLQKNGLNVSEKGLVFGLAWEIFYKGTGIATSVTNKFKSA